MSLVVDEHRQYLSDEHRISAFRKALQEVIRPHHVVIDLGCGTGILGLLACQAGAKRVYSIEETGMIELARGLSRANGFQDKMVFVKGLSTRLDLPEKADVVVADQIGRFGFEAGIQEFFRDVRRRLLKPSGIMIPSIIEMWLAPVEQPEMWKQVDFWNRRLGELDLSSVRTWAANTGYPATFAPSGLLGTPACGARIDLAQDEGGVLKLHVATSINREGTLHGIGGWFSAVLSPSSTMSNSPLSKERIDRRNIFFPIDQPVPLRPGDLVRVDMQVMPADLLVNWTVEIQFSKGTGANSGREKIAFKHSTLNGMLLSQEDLQRTGPDFAPRLTAWGQARLTVLELCDGKRPLAEIERTVLARHPELFRSLGDAARFSAEVITRYST